MVKGLFRGSVARNFKSASRYALVWFQIIRSITWIVLHSVLLQLLITTIIIINPEIVIPAVSFLVPCQSNKSRKAWQTKSWFKVIWSSALLTVLRAETVFIDELLLRDSWNIFVVYFPLESIFWGKSRQPQLLHDAMATGLYETWGQPFRY